MAHIVVGLDLGSHTVKAMTVKVGLRGSEIISFDTEPVALDADGRSSTAAVLEAAGRLVERRQLGAETIHCAIAGEHASLRTFGLPPGAARRLEQVLKFELDEALPQDIEESVFDYVELGRSAEEIRLLAAVVSRGQVRELLDGLREHGIDPREVGVAPLAYAVDLAGQDRTPDEVVAVVDLGHLRTNVALIGDNVRTTRTFLRGGHLLTTKLAEAGRISFEQAEAYKRRDGFGGKVGAVLSQAYRPLVREIRQTLQGHLAAGGQRVTKVLLCGGGALTPGVERFLADEIGVPVEIHGAPLGGLLKTLDAGQRPELAVLAHGLARREELQRARRINMRRGELAFKGDYAFLRRRIGWAVVCILGVLGAWIFANYAEYSVLKDGAERKREELATVTKELFGKPLFDRGEIEKQLGGEQAGQEPMPDKDAFDIVVELSRRIPPSVVHDVEALEIKPKRVTIKGLVDADLKTGAQTGPARDVEDEDEEDGEDGEDETGELELGPVDLVQQKLSEFTECFKAIRVGKVQKVDDRQRYQMDIESTCP